MNRFNPDNFDDFAPSEIVDYSIFSEEAKIGRKGKLRAQFDILIESSLTQIQGIEIFNMLNSVSHTANTGVTNVTPFDLYELKRQIKLLDACEPDITINYIFFDRFGNLIFQPRVNEYVKISCKQCSYKSLILSSVSNIFTIDKMRVIYTNVDQIDQPFTYTRKTFLGSEKKSTITPKSFLRPNQYQSLIVDLPAKFDIDGEKGFQYNIIPDLSMRTSISFYVSRYFKQQF